MQSDRSVFTVGHSTHELERFIALVEGHGIGRVADVRAHPGSRRMPHFNREAMAAALPEAGIEYLHLPELGGRRRPAPDSRNDAWDNAAFRGYADHMASEEFAAGLRRLEDAAAERATAVVCAEALWWRCHRRLLSDALTARGWSVLHIGADGRLADHRLPDFAVVSGETVRYPAAQGSLEV